MSKHSGLILLRCLAAIGIGIVGLIVLLTSTQVAVRVRAQLITPTRLSAVPQSSFVFRFDSGTQTFFTATLPVGSLPNSVVVSGTHPTHVWIAESGRDRLGHLVYTNTDDFAWVEYPVTSTNDSAPFRMTMDGNDVWFTERGANRIGRLEATTHHIDEFYGHGLSSNAGLADIKVAPDGQVWATEQWSNRLLQLTITSTADYAFREYTHTFLISPFGLAIGSNGDIWIAAPGAHKIGWFSPPTHSFGWPLTPIGDAPTELLYFFVSTGKPHSEVWFSDAARDRLGLLFLSTLPLVEYFSPITRATGIAREAPNVFWSTQQDAQGAVTRLIVTTALSTQIDSYLLPTLGLLPTSIAVAPDGGVWLTAYMPNRVYLPTILRN